MHQREDYIEIGRLRKALGYKGALRTEIKEAFQTILEDSKLVFVDDSPVPIPYFIETLNKEASSSIKFESISNKEAAHHITSRSLFLLRKDFKNLASLESEEKPYDIYMDCEIMDDKLGSLGKVIKVEEYPQQIMAVIIRAGLEVLIPLNDTFIKNHDPQNKLLLMDLPEGLLDT